MSQYYYTIAALPHLQYDSDYRGDEWFLDFCRETVSSKDLDTLLTVRLGSTWDDAMSPDGTARRWQAWEREFRMRLARLRAEKRKAEQDSRFDEMGSGDYYELADEAKRVFSEPDPLSAEEQILKSYWSKLEELEVSHYFDFARLVVYYLKLQVLSRKSRFTEEAGKEKFFKTYDRIAHASVSAGGGQADVT